MASSMPKTVGLYGGALVCQMSSDAQDVSVFREVPDNQEVFCHTTTDQSLIFDILEFQTQVNGEEAVKFHFNEVASVNDASVENEVLQVEDISKRLTEFPQCDSGWFLKGRQMISKFNENSQAKNLVDMYIGLFRLPKFQTDIVVTMNDPVAISSGSSSSSKDMEGSRPINGWTSQWFQDVLTSLKLVDESLFIIEE